MLEVDNLVAGEENIKLLLQNQKKCLVKYKNIIIIRKSKFKPGYERDKTIKKNIKKNIKKI